MWTPAPAHRHPARLVCLLATTLALCTAASRADDLTPIRQVWASTGTSYAETDSLAACRLQSGDVWVFATAKDGDRIDVFDAIAGRFLKSHGTPGTAPGQFRYPNGIVTVEFSTANERGPARTPLILIIERDNHRVQAFYPGDQRPAGLFGSDVLKRPYGGAVSYRPDGVYLYVTDTEVPRNQTVRAFRLTLTPTGDLTADLVRTFGDPDGPGAILEAESIAIDDRAGRVLLCDEDPSQHNVKVYTLDGQFTGQVFGGQYVKREPEGIVVVDTPAGGYVVLTDQQEDLSVWHVFDRQTYTHRAAFTGQPLVANTDGICIYPAALPRFPGGAFFAVHDDADVRAYPLDAITRLAESPVTHP